MIGTPSQHCGMSLRPKTRDAWDWDTYSECSHLMKSGKTCKIFFVKKEELRKHYRVPGMGVVTVKRLVCFSNQLRKQSIRVVCFLTSWSTETCFLFYFLVFFQTFFFVFLFFSNQLHKQSIRVVYCLTSWLPDIFRLLCIFIPLYVLQPIVQTVHQRCLLSDWQIYPQNHFR